MSAAETGYYFNPALLEIDNPGAGQIDLTSFELGTQLPGRYRVDIYINKTLVDTKDVEFNLVNEEKGAARLSPCLSVEQLKSWGVKVDDFPTLASSADHCAVLENIPLAKSDFLFNSQRLVLSLPQTAINKLVRNYISPERWDEGITALLLNYSFSGAKNNSRSQNGKNSSSQYLNLRPGINIGAWRLRNYSTWSSKSTDKKWDAIYTYAQRSIAPLKGQLTLGDSSSQSTIFDSVPFRGVQIASDNEMIPDSMKGYAPVVRGIAKTNAQVVIHQNGYIIYQDYVPPGAFEITDLYSTGGGGDLYVTIKEADGSEQHLTVPFASLAVLQREGQFKYNATLGQYRAYDKNAHKTLFSQLTGIYGMPHGGTVYGGVQISEPYKSAALGYGQNLGWLGALSIDATLAESNYDNNDKEKGQSWRVRYNKNILETGTNIALAGYRYSSEGFYSLQESLNGYKNSYFSPSFERRRNKVELMLNQNVWQNNGSLFFSLANESYWGTKRKTSSMALGYNNSWNSINYGINFTYNRDSVPSSSGKNRIHNDDKLIAFNISMPLFDNGINLNYNMNSSDKGTTSNSVGLNGVALPGRNLNWSVQEGYTNKGQGNSGSLNMNYKGSYNEISAGYGYDKNSRRVNYGMQGGVLVHGDGITLSQPLGETIALVKAPGANGVDVRNQTGVSTDYRGYTVVPYLSPYRKNNITLDPSTMPDDVDLDLTSRSMIPTRGAVVRASFNARVGNRVLMTLMQKNGAPVPFGAMVNDSSESTPHTVIVGDEGQVYLTGLAQKGTLSVHWGKSDEEQCRVDFKLPDEESLYGVIRITNTCQ